MASKVEAVPYRLIENACKRQERKNLRRCGRSTSWVSMLHYVNPFQLEYQMDHKVAIMKVGWREAIKLID